MALIPVVTAALLGTCALNGNLALAIERYNRASDGSSEEVLAALDGVPDTACDSASRARLRLAVLREYRAPAKAGALFEQLARAESVGSALGLAQQITSIAPHWEGGWVNCLAIASSAGNFTLATAAARRAIELRRAAGGDPADLERLLSNVVEEIRRRKTQAAEAEAELAALDEAELEIRNDTRVEAVVSDAAGGRSCRAPAGGECFLSPRPGPVELIVEVDRTLHRPSFRFLPNAPKPPVVFIEHNSFPAGLWSGLVLGAILPAVGTFVTLGALSRSEDTKAIGFVTAGAFGGLGVVATVLMIAFSGYRVTVDR